MGGVTGDNAMYLQQVIEATQELEQLIAALSAVAHGERGTLRLRPQPVDLGELVAARRPRAAAIALERDVAAGMVETDPARAVTSLVVAGRALRRGAGERAASASWRIADAPTRVTFGPLAGLDAELLRARPARLRGAARARAARRRRSRSGATA